MVHKEGEAVEEVVDRGGVVAQGGVVWMHHRPHHHLLLAKLWMYIQAAPSRRAGMLTILCSVIVIFIFCLFVIQYEMHVIVIFIFCLFVILVYSSYFLLTYQIRSLHLLTSFLNYNMKCMSLSSHFLFVCHTRILILLLTYLPNSLLYIFTDFFFELQYEMHVIVIFIFCLFVILVYSSYFLLTKFVTLYIY